MRIRSTRPTAVASRPQPAVAPRRVCLLIGQLGLGGAEKQLVLLARGLADRGVAASVAVIFGGGPREAALHAAGVPVTHLHFPRYSDRAARRGATGGVNLLTPARRAWTFATSTAEAIAGFRRLVALLRAERPDVLHAFLFHSYVVAAPASMLARVPVLVAGRRGLGDRHRERAFARLLGRVANRSTDFVIANAHAVARDAAIAEGLPEAKIATIYNGIPDSAFEPAAPEDLDAQGPVIVCVANLHWYKGHHHLISAVRLLREHELFCTLVLVGDGPERAALERQAYAMSVDARFLGSRDAVEPLLSRADVCVLPSLTEGMSNAIMEAMAVGKPIVATDVGGTRELLRGRGMLVRPGDPRALAEGLARVLLDPSLGVRLGAEARRWSRENLRLDTMIQRHLEVYGKLLGDKCAV